ncbi:DNA mismatch repair protein MutS [Flavobacterium psychrophilum]|uniref:DNA mismatch repair protein MutS n=2 Tax=Flavobacterium psychrophilum TaxID=96345 RepID=MUTS_FLAPJ|nr:DNA mismatch repair protein MutS [Flavobacterium psychrophilum]A6GWN3.1 RecName: Full=DNA mismatch repair protein MutS [Flavobacterium psychrophilum JIP02/86]AIG29311.1 DNA mismatch repair protein MutS [Flavobacterium psychrophilum]AIG31588.1 DNA mismatch repair protein MutS [Flavobacterium psychrophilum]AIG33742.1 DNA mismatch repair protein MutS [Flavobacterium psychrophilum]AIG36104.1 DNA mismatch repair protein MutS [Flavobacterium psychrophilum]AIG38370.1 DNA mismatch repair protein M
MSTKEIKETPLMKQYNEIKRKYPDACLLFRVGDFYETFGDDAVRASKILGITLTKRGAGSPTETALAGFPHHSINTYLPKLVKAGLRVAICDQLEDPKMTKTIVKRGVTELVTPGVSMNDEVLNSKTNNFLASIYFGKKIIGVSFLDVSTGEFLTSEGNEEYIDKLLQNFSPSEILVPKQNKGDFKEKFGDNFHAFYLEDWVYKEDYATETLTNHFQTNSLKGFGIEELASGIIASGAILYYLSETQHNKIQHITSIHRIAEDAYVWMDRFTIRNLELYHSYNPNAVTLLDIIDKTLSPMGGRMLKRWLALPLKNATIIKSRHEVVAYFKDHQEILQKVQNQIKQISDLERLISKVAAGRISPREIIYLKESLDAIIPIKELALKSPQEAVKVIGDSLHSCDLLREKIKTTLNQEAPVAISKGNAIAAGIHPELDELRGISALGKEYLEGIEKRESEKTGISSLKISFNNVFGYYIEVRNTHKDKVPTEWIRKQTLVNAERYITEELKEYETKILGAEEKIQQIENQLFEQLVSWIATYIKPVQLNANLIAQLDCLISFTQLAIDNKYVCPQINDSFALDIKNGRHPVIEKQLPIGVPYIANDVYLDRDTQQLIMITGPNMSGKSAILRQTALIVLLAQMGSFVPAESVQMGIVDKIFTRVGASDNISMGESTFMVEMNETASILNNISDRSLVLLDEIGRGTSTYDGVSIAWAIAEFLHENPAQPKTLFATHYHELNEMTESLPRIQNYNVSVKELKDTVLFIRKLVKGGSAHSFGIHVAKMAGMPQIVLQKAEKILKKLEKNHSAEALSGTKGNKDDIQLSIFNLDDPLLEEIKEEILNLDINTLTPVEALMKLNEIKRMLSKK